MYLRPSYKVGCSYGEFTVHARQHLFRGGPKFGQTRLNKANLNDSASECDSESIEYLMVQCCTTDVNLIWYNRIIECMQSSRIDRL